MVPVRREERWRFQSWAVPQLITSIRTSWKKFAASRTRVWTWFLTASVARIYGVPARLCVPVERSSLMVLLACYVAGDWLQVVPVIVIAFVRSPSLGSTLLAPCFSRAGNG